MVNADQLLQVKELLTEAKDILVIMAHDANTDQQAAATSLVLALTSLGKSAKLICPQIPSSDGRIYGLDQVTQEIGHQNLLISFDYLEEQVDKISYHIGEENKKFYLTVKPKKGSQPLDSKKVEFAYSGAETDLIITLGVASLDSLSQLYFGYEELYRDSKIININLLPADFGLVKLDLSTVSSFSELAAELIKSVGVVYQLELATNLLLGIESATTGLSTSNTTADTFSLVAELLRAGASRKWKNEELPPTVIATNAHLPKKNGKKPNKETTVTITKN